MKVYILFYGEYSDRSAVAVFSTKEAAEAADKSIDGDIEEFDFDPQVCLRGQGMNTYRIASAVDAVDVGEVKVVRDGDYWAKKEALLGGAERYSGVMHTYCFARDEAHAIKIAADRFRQFIAENGTANQKEKS